MTRTKSGTKPEGNSISEVRAPNLDIPFEGLPSSRSPVSVGYRLVPFPALLVGLLSALPLAQESPPAPRMSASFSYGRVPHSRVRGGVLATRLQNLFVGTTAERRMRASSSFFAVTFVSVARCLGYAPMLTSHVR